MGLFIPRIFKRTLRKLFLPIVSILLLVIFLFVFFANRQNRSTPYIAIFLDNGQVYFGKLRILDAATISLRNVYYIAPDTTLPEEQAKTGTASGELSLIKLGNEIHGPKDEMIINRDHVLFWEELQTTSKVVDAILKHKP